MREMLSNGKSREELQEEQRQQQLHQMNLNGARQEADRPMDTAYIEEMTNHQLEQGTIDLLSNMLDQNFMLSKLNDAEIHEYRWLARVLRLEVEALHPNEDSIWRGRLRAVAMDDTQEALPSLSEQDLAIIEQFLMGAISRATRGKDGWQQKMFNKTIQASETREVGDDDDGGFL